MANPPDSHDVTRRDFLKTTGAATASALGGSVLLAAARPSFGDAPAVSSRIIGANDRIHVGIIGVKSMGSGHVKHVLEQMPGENVELSAICDVWTTALRKAQADAKLKDDQVFGDFRRMLDARRELDAVIVATPDHTHALISVAAMESGRHVYVEKPMTRHLDEAFRMLDVSRRTKRLVQVGAQGCSAPKWQRAREIVRSGVLGRLLWTQGSYCRNNPAGEWNYDLEPEATEGTVDWKAWLGPARKRPWSAERYFRWRKYWDYGTGVIGDLLPHRLSPLMLAMDLNEFPKTVSCIGGNLCDTDKGPGKDGGKPSGERREVADTQLVLVEFPSGVMFFLASTTSNERGVDDVIRGQKANLTLGGNKLVLEPERPFSDEIERKDEAPEEPETNHANHVRNFLEAMRGNGALNCPIDLGIQVQTVVSMAEKAYREKAQVRFDPQRRKMTT